MTGLGLLGMGLHGDAVAVDLDQQAVERVGVELRSPAAIESDIPDPDPLVLENDGATAGPDLLALDPGTLRASLIAIYLLFACTGAWLEVAEFPLRGGTRGFCDEYRPCILQLREVVGLDKPSRRGEERGGQEESEADAGLVHLKGLPNLQTLTLSFTKITDAGLEHLKGLTKLQMPWLTDTRVTEAGIDQLKESLPKFRTTD
ncbi:MAG: hypothetical protein HRU01_16240 [Myxococcales bacterium]|nr:hypothetical protein [Myxococcales bacterium]